MGIRDRFYTPTTAKAILSWRILVGVVVVVGLAVLGVHLALAIVVGVGVYVVTVALAMPRTASRPAIDPFVLSEPWRQLIQSAQGARRRLDETVSAAGRGPLAERLRAIAEQLERGIDEAWAIARRGDEIDAAVRRLDPTGLRSKLATTTARAAADPSPDADAAIVSLQNQLATVERLQQRSDETASTLRLTQVKLDELVARASEVSMGAADTDSYARDVDDLVVQLEALHLAVEDTQTP